MSKAILVMDDIPVICAECNFAEIKGNNLYCIARLKMCYNSKPSWCPLKELPRKYEAVSMDFERGYNACIDEVLGGDTH